MPKSKIAKHRRRRNPDRGGDVQLAQDIAVGFAGYAGTRFLARMVYSQAIKRWPKAAQYAHVAAGFVGAIGTYFGTKFVERAAPYHEAATTGAAIAALQGAAVLLPRAGYVVADVSPEQYAGGNTSATIEIPDASTDDLDMLMFDSPELPSMATAASSNMDDHAEIPEDFELKLVQ